MLEMISFTARIVSGEGRGALLGSPTLNLDLADVPGELDEGVYAARCNGAPAVMHHGPRPTLGFDRSCEIHVLHEPELTINTLIVSSGKIVSNGKKDRNRKNAGKNNSATAVAVDVVARLRDVRRFENEEALKEKIAEDIENARTVLS